MDKDVVLAMLGSGAFFAFIQWLITFINDTFVNSKKKKQKELDDEELRMSTNRKLTRLQMLMLIADYPERTDEIMEVAHSYFVDLNGNWYAHGIFDEWLASQNLPRPNWYE